MKEKTLKNQCFLLWGLDSGYGYAIIKLIYVYVNILEEAPVTSGGQAIGSKTGLRGEG